MDYQPEWWDFLDEYSEQGEAKPYVDVVIGTPKEPEIVRVYQQVKPGDPMTVSYWTPEELPKQHYDPVVGWYNDEDIDPAGADGDCLGDLMGHVTYTSGPFIPVAGDRIEWLSNETRPMMEGRIVDCQPYDGSHIAMYDGQRWNIGDALKRMGVEDEMQVYHPIWDRLLGDFASKRIMVCTTPQRESWLYRQFMEYVDEGKGWNREYQGNWVKPEGYHDDAIDHPSQKWHLRSRQRGKTEMVKQRMRDTNEGHQLLQDIKDNPPIGITSDGQTIWHNGTEVGSATGRIEINDDNVYSYFGNPSMLHELKHGSLMDDDGNEVVCEGPVTRGDVGVSAGVMVYGGANNAPHQSAPIIRNRIYLYYTNEDGEEACFVVEDSDSIRYMAAKEGTTGQPNAGVYEYKVPNDGIQRTEQEAYELAAGYLTTQYPVGYTKPSNPVDNGISAELTVYGDSSAPDWVTFTLKHPAISVTKSAFPPAGFSAEWAASPRNEMVGSTWTKLGFGAFSESDWTEHFLKRASIFMLQTHQAKLDIDLDEGKALREMLRQNLTILRTTNVRLKPQGDSIYVW